MTLFADRYRVLGEIGAGGMATVELGQLVGPVGFSRLVAIKRLHPKLSRNPELVAMFVDEARLAARVRHPNVVSTLDVVHHVSRDGGPSYRDTGRAHRAELVLVLDYVHGDSLARLLRSSGPVPPDLAASIVLGLLHGLHAAHEAVGPGGVPLEIVHRDVSPENVLVGVDGIPRLADFGIAKARHRLRTTMDGSVRGKLPYMAPEQLTSNGEVDRRTDVYSASVVLWELLTGRLPLTDEDVGAILEGKARPPIAPPSDFHRDVGPELDAVVLRGLAMLPEERFDTAMEMATALERAQTPASQRLVAEWVREVGGPALAARAGLIDALEMRTIPARSSGAAIAGLATAPCSDGTLPERESNARVARDTVSLQHSRADAMTRIERRRSTGSEDEARGSGEGGAPSRSTKRPTSIPPMAFAPEAPRKERSPILRTAIVAVTAGTTALAVMLALSARLAASRRPASSHDERASIAVAPPPPAPVEQVTKTVEQVTQPTPPTRPLGTAAAAPARVAAPMTLKPKKASTLPARSSSLGMCEVPFRVDDDGVRIPKPGCW